MSKISRIRKNLKEDEKGFTISELMMTIVLMMIGFAVMANFFGFGLRALQESQDRSDADREASTIAGNLLWEIRTAESKDGVVPIIETANANEITFYRTVSTDEGPTRFHYYLTGTQLIKGETRPDPGGPPWVYTGGEQSEPVGELVRNDTGNPIFTYLDSDQVQFIPASQADRARISLIRIHIVCDKNTEKEPAPSIQDEELSLRNRD